MSQKFPTNPPDIVGQHGKAWVIDIDEISRKRGPGGPPRELQTGQWIVFAPWAHPVWSGYVIAVVSLRDAEGWPPAKINLEGATHEVFVAALDPDHDLSVTTAPRMLMPLNFCGQFIEPDDAAAHARVERAVRDIVAGDLNPDTDAQWQWVERFSGSNLLPGAAVPDALIALPGGGAVAIGTGASVTKALAAAAERMAEDPDPSKLH